LALPPQGSGLTTVSNQNHALAIAAAWSSLAFLTLLAVACFPDATLFPHGHAYLPVHSFMEAFACGVSVSIFGIGWYAARATHSARKAILSTAFLSVALLDFAHLMSYEGMTAMVTPSGTEKAIDFWLAARIAQTAGLFGYVVFPKSWRLSPYAILSIALAYTALAYWAILLHPTFLPRTFLADSGLTAFKIVAEYAVMATLVPTGIAIYRRRHDEPEYPVPILFAAVLLLLASEAAVTLYLSPTDNFNLLGHLYKVVGFYLIYKAIFVTSVIKPHHDLAAAAQAIRIRDTAFAASITPIAMAGMDGRIVYANHAFLELWGYASESDVIGREPADFFADRGEADRAMQGLRATGVWNDEFRGRRRDGTEIEVLVNSNIVADDAGNPIRMIGSFMNVTDRNRLEAERRRWADAFTRSAYGIAVTDATTNRQISVNPAYARMHGMTPVEMIGIDVESLYSEDSTAGRRAAVEQSNRIGHAEFDTIRRRKDGSTFPAHIWVSTIRDAPNQQPYRIATVVDMTDRNRMQDQLAQSQKMEAIGNLTGGIAHDFNNLLTVIVMNLEALEILLPDNADALELTAECLAAATSGAGLTQRLLAFARRQTLSPRSVAINGFVEGIVALLRRTLGENVVISLTLAPDLWPVFVDRAQLEASLLNLALNARDAMPHGGLLSIVTANKTIDGEAAALHPELTPGDFVTITVSDNGTGMPDEVKAHIFEPFYTTKSRGRGSGLGLSMVFGFLRQSNGLITVYSEPGKGSAFCLYLPRARAPAAEQAASPVSAPPLGSGETILVVEDNDMLRGPLVRQLSSMNYRVLQAANADNALAIVGTQPIDLVLTDIIMPGTLDGIALARAVLERRPGTRIVVTSGFTEGKVDSGGLQLSPAIRFLQKPFGLEELGQIVRETLDC
jgi:PAS domain S-box-containing protein